MKVQYSHHFNDIFFIFFFLFRKKCPKFRPTLIIIPRQARYKYKSSRKVHVKTNPWLYSVVYEICTRQCNVFRKCHAHDLRSTLPKSTRSYWSHFSMHIIAISKDNETNNKKIISKFPHSADLHQYEQRSIIPKNISIKYNNLTRKGNICLSET